MTPVFCCGFECGITGSHWTLSSAAFDTTTKRNGARSLKLTSGNPSATCTVVFSGTIHVSRFYIYFNTLLTGDQQLLVHAIAGNQKGSLMFNASDSTLRTRSGSNLAASGKVITAGQWYLVDMVTDVTNNPWTCDAKINGVSIAQSTNGVAASTITQILFVNGGLTDGDIYIDDIISSQTLTDYPIGPGYVNHFIPTSDGAHNVAGTGDFQRTLTGVDILNATTTAFQLIDDVPLESGASVDWINLLAPPNATDYVECVFGPAPGISLPTIGPRALEIIAGIHQAGTGTGNMGISLRDGSSAQRWYTATTVAGTTTVIYKRAHFTAPLAGGVWAAGAPGVIAQGNFNNLKVQFGSGTAVDANPDQYLDCVMIEAEFPYPLPKPININQSLNRAANW